jgi:hypothetical protein
MVHSSARRFDHSVQAVPFIESCAHKASSKNSRSHYDSFIVFVCILNIFFSLNRLLNPCF